MAVLTQVRFPYITDRPTSMRNEMTYYLFDRHDVVAVNNPTLTHSLLNAGRTSKVQEDSSPSPRDARKHWLVKRSWVAVAA